MDSSLSVQRQVKENVDEINDFIKDLKIWENEMKQKEQKLKEFEGDKEVISPIRTRSNLYEHKFSGSIKETNAEEEEEKRMELEEKCKLREQSLYEKELGNTAVKEHNWDKAIFHYTEAISCFENDATYYANRAFCFLKLKRFREAETDCTSALQLDETYVKALHRRAMCRTELNQLAEAYADLLKAQQLDPENTTVKNEISKLKKQLMKTGQLDILNQFSDEKSKAELKYEAACLEKDKGNQCVNKKQWNQAIEHYTNAIKLHESDIFYSNRALCYLKLDMAESALLDAKFASELNQSNVKAFHRQYLAFDALGQFVEAKNCLLKCLELDADNPTIINELKCLEEKIIASQTNTPSMDIDADVKNVMLQTDESNNNNDIDRYGTKRAVSNKLCREEKQIKKCRFDDDDGPFKEELISWERLNEIRVIKLQKWILKRIRKKCGKPLEEETPIKNSQSDYKKPSENYKKQQPTPTEEKHVEQSKPSFGFVFNFQSSKENEKFTSLKDNYAQTGFIPVQPSSTNLKKQTEKAKFVNVKWNELKTAKEDAYLNSLTDYVNKTTDPSATNGGSDLKAALLKLEQYAEQCVKENSLTFNDQNYNEKVNVVTTKEQPGYCSLAEKDGSQIGNVAVNADSELPSCPVPQFAIPKTYLQFTETMRIFQNNTYQQYLYLKKVHPSRFPQLFKDCLEENTLCQIINILEREFLKRNEDSVFEYLLNISKVNRFSTIILFALKDINKQLESLFRQCETTKKPRSDEVARLKKLYLI